MIDAYQERWLGTALLGLLYHRARSLRLRTLVVYSSPAGSRFVERLRRLGGVSAFQDGLLRIELPVHADPMFLPRNQVADRLRTLLREYEAAFGQGRTPRRRHVA